MNYAELLLTQEDCCCSTLTHKQLRFINKAHLSNPNCASNPEFFKRVWLLENEEDFPNDLLRRKFIAFVSAKILEL